MSHEDGLEPYAVRFIKQVAKSTWHVSVTQQLITVFPIGFITVLVNVNNGLITAELSWAYLRAAAYIMLISYGLIILLNILRAPFLLDREQSQRVIDLTVRLSSAENELREGQQLLGSTAARLQEAEANRPPAKANLRARPNMVVKRVRVAPTNQAHVINGAGEDSPTALVEFKNEPETSPPSETASVRASISFEEINGEGRHEVADGMWLSERERCVRFRLGDAKELIVAVQARNGVKTIRVHEREARHQLRYFQFELGDLTGSEYTVEIQLVAERPTRFLGTHRFKLTTRPQLLIESL